MSDRRFFRHAIPFLAGALVSLISAPPAQALSMKECSVKFKAAQDTGEATGVSWSEFRKTQCARTADQGGASDSATPETTDSKQPKPAEGKAEENGEDDRHANQSCTGKDNLSLVGRSQIRC